MNKKNKVWVVISLGGILLSALSLILPIITYSSGLQSAQTHSYNIIQLIQGGFAEEVQAEYIGDYLVYISFEMFDRILIGICAIGVGAIILSCVGLNSMSKQYESHWPFRMTIVGLLGTMVPSLALIAGYVLSKDYYLGDMTLGAYVFVTPTTMLLSCSVVSRRHKLTLQERRLQKEAERYIYPAGDLR